MSVFLAIDIGASSGRHIVGRVVDNKLITEEVYRFPNGATSRDGRLFWEIDKLFAEILNGLRIAGEKGLKPDYIGIDTWAVDYVLLDEKDEPILPVYSYRDRNCAVAADRVHKIVPFEELYKVSGIQYQPFNTVYRLYDDVVSGRINRAKSMLMLPDYFDFRLTGVKKQEYTNATSTALVGINDTWDEGLLDRLSLPRRLFGELSAPGETVGKFLPEVEKAVGYSATVLLPATHDTASAVLASLTEDDGCYISSGTWSLLGVEQKGVRTDDRSRKYNYSNEGSVLGKRRYQKNIMGLWMIQKVREELGEKISFAALADMAEKCPDFSIVDVNDPRFLSPENMTVEIERAAGKKFGSSGELVRTVFESLAVCYDRSIKELEELTGRTISSVNIIGGGCNNAFLNKLTALRSRKRIIVGPEEGTALGNLIVQMNAVREAESLASAKIMIRNSFEIGEIIL